MYRNHLRFLLPAALAGLVCAVGSVAVAPQAVAQDDSAYEEALRLFQLAELHYQGNEFEQAADLFSRAYELQPDAVLGLNAALAYENAGQLETAAEWFETVLTHDPAPDIADQANRGIRRITAILQSIAERREMENGNLVLSSTPTGASVVVDSVVVGETPYNEEISPGDHTLWVELEGYQPYEDELTVNPSETLRIVIPLERVVANVVVDPIGPGDSTDPEERNRRSLVPVYILGGVTVAASVAGIAFAGRAATEHDFLASEDPDLYRDDELFQLVADDGRQAQTLSTVSYGVAIAAGVGTVAYLIFGGRGGGDTDTEDDESAASITFAPTGLGGVMNVTF